VSFLYYMPTKLIHGIGAIERLPELVRELGMSHPLLVTDPPIKATPVFQNAQTALEDAGIAHGLFDECAIDARLHHVDDQAARMLAERMDGVVCIGGGSVMCAGKAMAIVAAQGGGSFADYAGFANFDKPALPMIMVPTTAGSGSEVSQVTLVKDEATHSKFIGGGPLSFPQIAILDPIVLASCPQYVNAVATIDALTHCMDSLFNTTTTPLTQALALEAMRIIVANARASVLEKDPQAMADHLLASAMANMSCGNAKLGLSHTLSLPMESGMDLTHGVGVGVLMPRVLRYSAQFAPERMAPIGAAWGLGEADGGAEAIAERVEQAAYALFDEIGFPRYYDPADVDPANVASIAMEAGRGLYGEGYAEANPGRDTPIATFNLGTTTIARGEALLAQCWA
jgi:alcohol dehydrogenase class IV